MNHLSEAELAALSPARKPVVDVEARRRETEERRREAELAARMIQVGESR